MRKDWKYKLGITCLILSFCLPLLGFLVPFFDLPTALKAAIIAGLSVGGPEIMIVLAVLLLGKKAVVHFKKKLWGFFKLKKPPKPVSKPRYYIGLFLFFFSLTPLYIAAYAPHVLPGDETARFLITTSGDFVFVLSFFILGAQFWEKFKRLFVWEPGPNNRRSK